MRLKKINEQWLILILLSAVFLFVVADLVTDSREQLKGFHLLIEVSIGLFSLLGIIFYYVMMARARIELADSQMDLSNKTNLLNKIQSELIETKNELKQIHEQRAKLIEDLGRWKNETDKHIKGLSESIDRQLDRWQLTAAEKDIALLLLKGLGLKEIASLRGVAEKTVRAQATSIYNKSGLAGRSELAAFFLEDLLTLQ